MCKTQSRHPQSQQRAHKEPLIRQSPIADHPQERVDTGREWLRTVLATDETLRAAKVDTGVIGSGRPILIYLDRTLSTVSQEPYI